jgi:Flp pilus assembly pilin Flp
MQKMLQRLWQDDAGIVALEYLLVATIVGLGLVVGLSNLEIALDTELTELGNAILALNQGYSFVGLTSSTAASKTGSCVTDTYFSMNVSNQSAPCVGIDFGVP